jgi:hypothetical protein
MVEYVHQLERIIVAVHDQQDIAIGRDLGGGGGIVGGRSAHRADDNRREKINPPYFLVSAIRHEAIVSAGVNVHVVRIVKGAVRQCGPVFST